jgi:valyl-tRNA synthetase
VQEMFKKMFDSGLIYRGDYLVNWDPVAQTALADDEVEYEERESNLYYIRYYFPHSKEYLVVATVRPETLLGDTGVAVSMEDVRYKKFVGKKIVVPLVNRTVPVIADFAIDPTFGTGAVKITPAHDFDDHSMSQRHNLPLINILTPDGCINENGKEFMGLSVDKAREAVVAKLKSLDLIEKIERYKNRVGVSYRSKAVIEPYLSKQWFVRVSSFKDKLVGVVKSGQIALIPRSFETTYFHWIDHLRDWCISRQLWWGHRIPVWHHKEDLSRMICYIGEGAPKEVLQDPLLWELDGDVLDTWFSSALWPFSVLGWPENTEDLKKFYPTAVLVTGHDILFFWVARMIMMGEFALQEKPFSEVFLHGLIFGRSYWHQNPDGSIRYLNYKEALPYEKGVLPIDGICNRWEKMSKSKGNIIDPLEIIDSYGTDAMRIALVSSTTHARQIDLDRRRFEEFKNFINKIWNGARFVLMNLDGFAMETGIDRSILSLEDEWILSKLNRIIQSVNQYFEKYGFDKVAHAIYDFFWNEFCAYYVEIVKPILFGKTGTPQERENKQKILFIVLCNTVTLLHPIAPFITEELFQLLKNFPTSATEEPYTQGVFVTLQQKACIVAPYPRVICPTDINAAVEEEFLFIERLLYAVRNIRAEMQIPPTLPISLYFISPSDSTLDRVRKNQKIFQALIRLGTLAISSEAVAFPVFSTAVVDDITIIIPLPLELKEKEKNRLIKEHKKLLDQQQKASMQLLNQEFVAKARPEFIINLKNNLQRMEKELLVVMEKLNKIV